MLVIAGGLLSCNQPKSLSGIETEFYRLAGTPAELRQVAINLNPYQGLKRSNGRRTFRKNWRCNQPKSLSGIETLMSDPGIITG